MQTKISKISLVLLSSFMFAACAKKADPLTYDKVEKPKKELAAPGKDDKNDKAQQQDPVRTDDPADAAAAAKADGKDSSAPPAGGPAAAPKANDTNKDQPAANVTVPAPVVSGIPAPAVSSVPATTQTTTQSTPESNSTCKIDGDPTPDGLCTNLIAEDPKKIEACLVQKVAEYSTQLKTENRELNKGSLNWVLYRSKEDCHASNIKDQELLNRVYAQFQEVILSLFDNATETMTAFMATLTAKVVNAVPTVKVLSSKEYRYAKVVQYGSRDFRQPKNAVNYSMGKIQKTVHMSIAMGDETPAPVKTSNESQRDIFSNLSSYSFGYELKANKTYTLNYKDESGELTLDYGFYEGSMEAFQKGESAKVVLTKASWLKVIEFETQKILDKEFHGIPRSSLRISLSPLDPPTARTCSIGKGYFLGFRAIACNDPEYKIRIQVLDTTGTQQQ